MIWWRIITCTSLFVVRIHALGIPSKHILVILRIFQDEFLQVQHFVCRVTNIICAITMFRETSKEFIFEFSLITSLQFGKANKKNEIILLNNQQLFPTVHWNRSVQLWGMIRNILLILFSKKFVKQEDFLKIILKIVKLCFLTWS